MAPPDRITNSLLKLLIALGAFDRKGKVETTISGGGYRENDEYDNNFDDDDAQGKSNDGNDGNDDSSSNGCILKTSFGTNLIGRGASRTNRVLTTNTNTNASRPWKFSNENDFSQIISDALPDKYCIFFNNFQKANVPHPHF